jgi:hypothetical protein
LAQADATLSHKDSASHPPNPDPPVEKIPAGPENGIPSEPPHNIQNEVIGSLTPRRCTSIRRDGTRCDQRASIAGLYCRTHSALNPGHVARSMEQLGRLSEVLTERLVNLALDPLTEDRHVIAACQLVFDRVGLGPEMTIKHKNEFEERLKGMPLDALIARANELKLKIESDRKLLPADTVDAEVIEVDAGSPGVLEPELVLSGTERPKRLLINTKEAK